MKGSYEFNTMQHQWGWPEKSQARKAIFLIIFLRLKKDGRFCLGGAD
jgi:hypothetical protein